MKREYYSSTISKFLKSTSDEILGKLAQNNDFALEQTQRDAWLEEIRILQITLQPHKGSIYFEYSIPRMGKRIDVLLLIGSIIFVLEFKVGEKEFHSHSIEQTWDYALDLKYFHETSHECFIAPILIATKAKPFSTNIILSNRDDNLLDPITCNEELLSQVIFNVLNFSDGKEIYPKHWETGRYQPTPTIIEAAKALYKGHSVSDISRRDASAINLSKTTRAISEIIKTSKEQSYKSICFVTGVPGSGKTLVGLDIATKHIDDKNELYSVFLSGNGPLVNILQEALTRDKVQSEKEQGRKLTKKNAHRSAATFIQNVHHFRDEYIRDQGAPLEHVTLFDEAQRAWNLEKTADFMKRRKNIPNFNLTEPEFLISCLDRHNDWAVIVCLVGGGQEINQGEAGISEWIQALENSFPKWRIYISPRMVDNEYGTEKILNKIKSRKHVIFKNELHLSVSMRSFRAENVSLLVKQVLDLKPNEAKKTLVKIKKKYPIVITRDITRAKHWLKTQARGSERYGMIVSSKAERLKPYALNVKAPVNPIHWFLEDKDDIRSSYYLEDVVTEFDIQGLELDWACITWDADFRYTKTGWSNWSLKGNKWQRINKPELRNYQKNAYRVLLTRARQGMVIVVPSGDEEDHTRKKEFYDPIFEYLQEIGFDII
jgi:hypothetical protein